MNPKPTTKSADSPGLVSAGGAALMLLVLLVYLPSLRGGFIWDDLLLVNENPLVKGEFTFGSIWFRTDFPLSNVALWLEWLAFAKNATGYRIVNVILHATSATLLWRLLGRMKIPGAWFAAALFAVYPVAVASVAWISEIKNTLSLPFYLLSFWFYLGAEAYSDANRTRLARWNYLFSLLAFVLALLAKTSTVMLPVILLACAWWQRGRITKQDCLRTAPHFALALAFGLMTVWFQTQQTLAGFTLPQETFAARLAGAGLATWFYLGKALLPLQLNAIYPRWEINPHGIATYLPLLLLVVATAVCCWFRRSWGRHLLFALVCFVASLFPVLGFFDMYFLVFSRVSDHFQYLALIVPLTALAALIHSLRASRVAAVILLTLVLGLSLLATGRARIYATDESLWRDTLAKNPAAWNAHNNLGCILAEKNELAGATEHFLASLKLNPRNAGAHVNYGKVLLLKNNFAGAESHFRTALEIKPGQVHALLGSAEALAAQGRNIEAVESLRAALQLKPDNATRLQLAPLLSSLGRDAEAVAELQAVLAAQPDALAALQNLAWILATSWDEKIRNGTEAVRLAERACKLTNRQEARMLSALAAALAETGKFPEAVATAQQAIELAQASSDPGFAQINAQLLRLYRAGKPYHSAKPQTR
jgi:tetratricopeptide (TPR) repeat protein